MIFETQTEADRFISFNKEYIEEVPFISLAKLKEAIPEYDWEKGHSGELLPKDVAEALSDLWAGE